jgi:hypothetical protein
MVENKGNKKWTYYKGIFMDGNELKDLQELIGIQGRKGNWDHDDYMCGMFNGMELALSIFEHREPIFRSLKETKGETK